MTQPGRHGHRSNSTLKAAMSTRPGPNQPGPARSGPARSGPTRPGPSQAGPSQAGPSQAGPSQAGPSQAGPSQAGPSQAGPSQLSANFYSEGHLHQLIDLGSVQQLIEGVEVAKALLGQISPILGSLGTDPELLKLIEAVTSLEAKALTSGPIIGVVGTSGSGKSTLINALLGEDHLAPTSSYEACTAVITKFVHNDCDEPNKKYRAEIEFMSKEDWKMELDTLGGDVGVSEVNETLSEELLARVHAVYPHIDETSFVDNPELSSELLALPHVRKVLGATMHLSARTAASLSEKLQPYIAAAQESSPGKEKPELWPLVKEVRIFTKAAVLQTGLVLVDLPGSEDSNPARAAVAGKFLKDCNGIWIVARMDRAATESTVFELMGTQFLQQLQLDGKFSTITLICTHSDDISEAEAVRNLKGDKAFLKRRSEIEAQIAKTEQALAINRSKINLAEHRYDEIDSACRRLDWRETELLKALNELYRAQGKENMVAVPRSPPRPTRKRKRQYASGPAGKCIAYTHKADDSGQGSSRGTKDDDDNAMDIDPDTVMMTKDAIVTEQATIATRSAHQEEQRMATDRELEALETAGEQLKQQLHDQKPRLLKHVIETRNAVVAMKARQQYSIKLREMDQEVEDDGVQLLQLKPRQWYEEAAKQLNVFCVSNRAYLLLIGPTDEVKNGFNTEEETQIPQLQRYAMEFADDYRAAACRQFLHEFSELVATLLFQVVSDETPLQLGGNVREQELDHLDTSLASLEGDLLKCEREFTDAVLASMRKIFAKFGRAAQLAKAEAGMTLDKLFVKSRGNGQYVSYQTFLAICQPSRNGVFRSEAKGKKGVINLNAELMRPFKDSVTPVWTVVFGKEIPDAIDELGRRAADALAKFNVALKSRQQLSTGPSFDALQKFLKVLANRSRENGMWKQFVVDNQKTVNRLITESLREQMEGTYKACLQTPTGAGRYERMKQLVRDRVNDNSVAEADMFGKTASEVQKGLSRILQDLRKKIREKHTLQGERLLSEKLAPNVSWILSIKRRCKKLVNGTLVFADVKESRDNLRALLTSVDDSFARILAGEAADTQVAQGDVEMWE